LCWLSWSALVVHADHRETSRRRKTVRDEALALLLAVSADDE